MDPFETLPDENITDICNAMDIYELENFVISSERNYNLCYNVLRNKRLALKNIILNRLAKLKPGYELDVSKLTPRGTGMRQVLTDGITSKMKVAGYPIITSHERYREIFTIMNTN